MWLAIVIVFGASLVAGELLRRFVLNKRARRKATLSVRRFVQVMTEPKPHLSRPKDTEPHGLPAHERRYLNDSLLMLRPARAYFQLPEGHQIKPIPRNPKYYTPDHAGWRPESLESM
jgi:hypothetical protein